VKIRKGFGNCCGYRGEGTESERVLRGREFEDFVTPWGYPRPGTTNTRGGDELAANGGFHRK